MSSLNIFCQDTTFIYYGKFRNNEIDTLIANTPYDQPILHGTIRLPNTENQTIAKTYGLYFDRIISKGCTGGGDNANGESSIDSIYTIDSTLFIMTTIRANCCSSFLCDINLKNDTTINLIYYDYAAEICACVCCFGITYQINLFDTYNDYFDQESRDKLIKINSVMLNGKIETLKRFEETKVK